ncbi:MAG: flavodoxin domain-containing protein, partial [Pseudomonadota bacterium]|nr:flavodoxin domain-containing protein [Pseudomonadota bacterium]
MSSALSQASVGIIFGTDTGNTEDVAEKISEQLQGAGIVAELVNITDAEPEQIQGYDLAIMGIPTWDFGGIQVDWEDVEEMIQALDMSGKTVA